MNNRFKELRKTLKLKQDEIAKILNKSTRMIQYYEQGKFDIETDLLLKLQELYNINLNWLITGTGEMFLNNDKKNNKNNRYEFLNRMLDDFSDEELAAIIKTTQAMADKKNNKISKIG